MKNKLILTTLTLGALTFVSACTSNDSNDSSPSSSAMSTTTQTSTMTSETSQSSSTSSTDSTSGEALSGIEVSLEDALKEFDNEYPDAEVTSVDLEEKMGSFYYNIEGVDDDNEYEINVNAETKRVHKDRPESLDNDEKGGVKREEDAIDRSNLLTIEKTAELAIAEVGGGQAYEWELDKDMNITYIEVKVRDGNTKTEVKLDAQSGEVLEVDVDD